MPSQEFSEPKVLWYIQFYPRSSDSLTPERQEADLYIPMPPGEKNQWMNTRGTLEKNQKAIGYLRTIEKMCEELKKECIQNADELEVVIKESDPSEAKSTEIGKKLKNLEILFNKFSDILKWLNKPSTGDSP